MRTKTAILFICCLSLFVAACSGFKPRTENAATEAPLYGQQVSIAENKKLRADFLDTLRNGLSDSGARLLDKAAPGVIDVKITGLEEDKTVSAYSSVRQVREFNHYIELDFVAQRGTGKNAKAKQVTAKVRAERTQIYDSRYVLGVSEEERSIRAELRAEVVRLLALKLSVL